MGYFFSAVPILSLPTRHGRGLDLAVASFDNQPASPVLPLSLQSLKLRLLHRALQTFCESHFEAPLRRAAEQAALLAMESGYPLLTFPELFRELSIPAMARLECQILAGVDC